MDRMKYIKFFGLVAGLVVLNILVLSPGFLGISIGGSALSTACGITLLVASAIILFYGCYMLLFKPPAVIPVKKIRTHEDYVEALNRYRNVKSLQEFVTLALEQLDRILKKRATLMNIINQRFDEGELSHKKFSSVAYEVEKLFYLNVKSILNRLSVFDESEYLSVMNQRQSKFSREILEKKTKVYNEYLSFMKSSLSTNEEILLKLDKLIIEISRLDSFEPGDIDNMPCMQEIDSLIKQTKLYKQ